MRKLLKWLKKRNVIKRLFRALNTIATLWIVSKLLHITRVPYIFASTNRKYVHDIAACIEFSGRHKYLASILIIQISIRFFNL